MPRRTDIASVLGKLGIPVTGVKIQVTGYLHLEKPTPLVIEHRGGSPSKGIHYLYVNGREIGSIGDDVRDTTGRVPILWFQETDEHETPRQRFHVDVWVPPEVAEQRIAAAVAAGGIVVDDSQAPSYTVIADQDGNKACVCTSLPPAQER